MEAIRLVKTAHPDQIEIMNLLSTPLRCNTNLNSIFKKTERHGLQKLKDRNESTTYNPVPRPPENYPGMC